MYNFFFPLCCKVFVRSWRHAYIIRAPFAIPLCRVIPCCLYSIDFFIFVFNFITFVSSLLFRISNRLIATRRRTLPSSFYSNLWCLHFITKRDNICITWYYVSISSDLILSSRSRASLLFFFGRVTGELQFFSDFISIVFNGTSFRDLFF